MPFDRTLPYGVPATVGISEYDDPDPAFMDTVGAAFRQENIIGSFLSSARRGVDDFARIDEGYNVFDDVKRDGLERHAERFEEVYNPIAYRAVKADIEREERDRRTLEASGWTDRTGPRW